MEIKRLQGLRNRCPGIWCPRGTEDAVTPIPQVFCGVEDLIGNLRSIVLILDGAAILVQDTEAQVHLGNLGVNRSVEHPESAADYRLVIFEWIPGERDTRGDVAVIGIQRQILRINFITEPVVQREIGSDLPGVLQIESG